MLLITNIKLKVFLKGRIYKVLDLKPGKIMVKVFFVLFTLREHVLPLCVSVGAQTRLCAGFYRERVEGPQSIIKS